MWFWNLLNSWVRNGSDIQYSCSWYGLNALACTIAANCISLEDYIRLCVCNDLTISKCSCVFNFPVLALLDNLLLGAYMPRLGA